jgi:hypothetical protein
MIFCALGSPSQETASGREQKIDTNVNYTKNIVSSAQLSSL